MAKPTRRLHLRLAQDNPIFAIPAGERTRQAEQWLRLGAEIERLEKAIDKLEKLAGGQIITQPIQDKPVSSAEDKKAIAKNVVDAFENW